MKHRYSFLIAVILLLSGIKASAAYSNYPFNNYSFETDTPKIKIKQVVPMGVDTTKYKPVVPVYRDVVGDSSVIPKSRMNQERAFMQGTYLYPPKPRSMWEVALNAGEYLISANVRSIGGYGIGASLQKSLGYVVSLKTLYFHGVTYGLNWEASSGLANNTVLNGQQYPNINYAASKLGVFYYNYENITNELVEQAMFSVNNIGFHKKALDRKFNLYIGIGGGAMEYKTWYDALDKNGQIYNYSGIEETTDISDRKTIIKDLKSLMSGTSYSTPAQGETDEAGLFGGTFRPVVTGTVGVAYHLSRRFDLGIYENATFTYDRLLDGDEWQEHPHNDPALTGPYDNTHYIYATVGYFFGIKKSVEPLYWQNPMEYTYDALNTLIKKNVDDLIDTDDDGVVDRLDREPNSAPGAIVDTHGVTKDSDGDGIPDYLDKEPFSPPGVKVDSTGVTLPQYRPVLRNQIDSVIRHDVATGALSGLPGGGGGIGGVGGNYCNMTNFPTVNFDLDKYNIKPEFFAHLYEVAMAMMACPDKKMVAIGNTDDRETSEYNDVLSWERVNKCIDYLVANYGISRDRFIVKAEGKAKPLVPGLPDHGLNPIYESRQYLNRRVEFHWAQQGETGPSSLPKPKGPQKAGKEW